MFRLAPQKAGRMNGRGEFCWKNRKYLDELKPA
jgi:hypothetical protein